MTITERNIIGELVAEDYRTAPVFKNYGIDFCCKGNRTISEACEKNDQNLANLLNDLNLVVQKSEGNNSDFKSWPLDLLADYIEKKHHRYVESRITEIKPFLNKVVRVHGDRHPELAEIEKHFLASAGELAAHMKKEELILFPFIRKMVNAKQGGETVDAPYFGTIQNPVAMMKDEHTTEGERFGLISQLSNVYTPPADACNTYAVTFALLKEFEEDLHMHIHLENNILFPGAIEMEKELREPLKA